MPTTLVTAATGGIGSAVCARLATSGHRLVLTARDLDRLEALRSALPTAPSGPHEVAPMDMASLDDVRQFGEFLRKLEVGLDGMVLMPPQPHADTEPMPDAAVWQSLFQTSFIGPLEVLKVAITAMRPDPAVGRRCKIVVISGISSAQVMGNYATSNVLRTAWLGEAKTLAFVLGERGIHINTLSLGGTLSPSYREGIERRAAGAGVSYDQRLAEETANVPLRKYGHPSEVAGAVEGLLSDFSNHLTGLNLLHDGGFTRAY